MASASVLLKLAEELTEKQPDCQCGWAMLGCVQNNYFNNPSMAAKAFVKAAVAAGQTRWLYFVRQLANILCS